METVSENKETTFKSTSDFVQDAIKCADKICSHVYDFMGNSIYYSGKCSGYIFSGYKVIQASIYEKFGIYKGVTITRLVKNDAAVDEPAKRDFYMSLGRDIVELTRADSESENLTIIDLSKYSLENDEK